jgi:hypothetical protein
MSRATALRVLEDIRGHVGGYVAARQREREAEASQRYATDPVGFAVDRLGWTPDPWQAKVLSSPSKRILLNCSRQSGKSTTTSVLALHTAIFEPGSLTLLISPTQRQSSELFRKVTGFLRRMERRPLLIEDNAMSCTFENESRVVSLPGSASTIRGYSSPSLIIEDEAAFVEDGVNRAARPMLAVSGGKMILMSTPYGRRGHFHDAWKSDEEWQRIEVKAEDCPRIPAQFLLDERKALGDWWFRQEYGAEFLETADQLFHFEDINRALSDDVAPLFPAFDPPPGGPPVKPLFDLAA